MNLARLLEVTTVAFIPARAGIQAVIGSCWRTSTACRLRFLASQSGRGYWRRLIGEHNSELGTAHEGEVLPSRHRLYSQNRFSNSDRARLTVLVDTPKACAISGMDNAVDRDARAIASLRLEYRLAYSLSGNATALRSSLATSTGVSGVFALLVCRYKRVVAQQYLVTGGDEGAGLVNSVENKLFIRGHCSFSQLAKLR
jgi:hypothetical protein